LQTIIVNTNPLLYSYKFDTLSLEHWSKGSTNRAQQCLTHSTWATHWRS